MGFSKRSAIAHFSISRNFETLVAGSCRPRLLAQIISLKNWNIRPFFPTYGEIMGFLFSFLVFFEILLSIMTDLSPADFKLLAALQADADLSQQELAEIAGMSKTSVWRRVRDLEEAGIITDKVALLDARALGLNIHVMVSVSMVAHSDDVRRAFEAHVETLAPVTECYAVSGDWDYLLHVLIGDIDSYNRFLNQELLNHRSVRSASSSFALKRVKYTTRLPIRI